MVFGSIIGGIWHSYGRENHSMTKRHNTMRQDAISLQYRWQRGHCYTRGTMARPVIKGIMTIQRSGPSNTN